METKIGKKKDSVRCILDAAAKIFAEAGFEGARVDKIANRAGVNKAMIYYHVGDKKALYARVLHNVLGDTAARMDARIKVAETPAEKLQAYIRSLAETFDRHSYLPPILMREIASGGAHLSDIVVGDLAAIVGLLTEVLREGKEKGEFTDVNPLLIHLMVIGGFSFFKTSGPLRSKFSRLIGKTVNIPDHVDVNRLAREIEKLIRKAIQK